MTLSQQYRAAALRTVERAMGPLMLVCGFGGAGVTIGLGVTLPAYGETEFVHRCAQAFLVLVGIALGCVMVSLGRDYLKDERNRKQTKSDNAHMGAEPGFITVPGSPPVRAELPSNAHASGEAKPRPDDGNGERSDSQPEAPGARHGRQP